MRLVLLDRDGVLNEDRADYVKTPAELVLLKGAAAAVGRLNRAGIKVALVTNQSAVGRGLIDATTLTRIHDRLAAELAAATASLDALYVAPDAPEAASERRKPGTGMVREAMARFAAGPGETALIGDSRRDLVAAAAVGCRRLLVRSGHDPRNALDDAAPALCPFEIVDDLAGAVDRLLTQPCGAA